MRIEQMCSRFSWCAVVVAAAIGVVAATGSASSWSPLSDAELCRIRGGCYDWGDAVPCGQVTITNCQQAGTCTQSYPHVCSGQRTHQPFGGFFDYPYLPWDFGYDDYSVTTIGCYYLRSCSGADCFHNGFEYVCKPTEPTGGSAHDENYDFGMVGEYGECDPW